MNSREMSDVLVLGAGPAGSTVSALLAEKGWNVRVLEKQKFPRYHIGESLLPFCYFTLERLGLIEAMNQSAFPRKYSVQFVSTRGNVSQPFYFFQHLDHPASTTWQVVRADFDMMLMNHARQKGVVILEEMAARALIEEDGRIVGVKAQDKNEAWHEFRAAMTIDATGIDSFSVKQLGWRIPDPSLNKVAVWTYYKGALRDPGLDEGATTVAYLPEKGWFWYIPLPDDVVSVGIVAAPSYLYREGRDPERMFRREIEQNDWIRRHLEPGQNLGYYRAKSDYSYRSRYVARDGLVLTGDAFSFLDPVFSSGVFLALRGGELAADVVDAALRDHDVSAERFDVYGETLCQGIEAMRKLVYAFYDHEFSFRELLNKYPHFRGDLTDCLIGNLFIDFDPLFQAVSEFAAVPPPLAHGRSMAPSR